VGGLAKSISHSTFDNGQRTTSFLSTKFGVPCLFCLPFENIRELLTAAAESAEREESLRDFLDHAALISDQDAYDERAPLTLMTLHTAKGLEFCLLWVWMRVCFLTAGRWTKDVNSRRSVGCFMSV
jgi:ATP-dependent exoDNAse (exonuclease V) beta subunit